MGEKPVGTSDMRFTLFLKIKSPARFYSRRGDSLAGLLDKISSETPPEFLFPENNYLQFYYSGNSYKMIGRLERLLSSCLGYSPRTATQYTN